MCPYFPLNSLVLISTILVICIINVSFTTHFIKNYNMFSHSHKRLFTHIKRRALELAPLSLLKINSFLEYREQENLYLQWFDQTDGKIDQLQSYTYTIPISVYLENKSHLQYHCFMFKVTLMMTKRRIRKFKFKRRIFGNSFKRLKIFRLCYDQILISKEYVWSMPFSGRYRNVIISVDLVATNNNWTPRVA